MFFKDLEKAKHNLMVRLRDASWGNFQEVDL
jgi:hypothetical protein